MLSPTASLRRYDLGDGLEEDGLVDIDEEVRLIEEQEEDFLPQVDQVVPSDELFEFLYRSTKAIAKERETFLEYLALIQPDVAEGHRLEWTRQQEEDDIVNLEEVIASRRKELEEEKKKMRSHEEEIQKVRKDQREDRAKIQRLLALSQPVTHDITVVFELEAEEACRPSKTRAFASEGEGEIDVSPSKKKGGSEGGKKVTRRKQIRTRGYEMYLERRLALLRSYLDGLESDSRKYLERMKEDEVERASHVDEFRALVDGMRDQVASRLGRTKKHLDRATADYLCLRHNAKCSHEATVMERELRLSERNKLKVQVEGFRQRVEGESEMLRKEAERRLDIKLSHLRRRLGEVEVSLQGVRNHFVEEKRRMETEIATLLQRMGASKKELKEIDRKRAENIPALNDAVRELRHALRGLESRAYGGHLPY